MITTKVFELRFVHRRPAPQGPVVSAHVRCLYCDRRWMGNELHGLSISTGGTFVQCPACGEVDLVQ